MNLKTNLKNQYVAFLDVMGFKNLVYGGDLKRLESYFDRIKEVLNTLKTQKSKIQSFLISDSIILITPNTESDFENLIIAIRRIQSSLLWKKILLRGAVSFGEVYYDKDNNLIVGKGFIKAYLLEQEANFPRVIIDPAIIKNFGETKTDFLGKFDSLQYYENFERRLFYSKSNFAKISDDAIFIDYANKVIKETEINGNMKYLYATIKENLYSDQKLFTKYIWLRDYFLELLRKMESISKDNLSFSKAYRTSLLTWIHQFEEL